MTIRMIDNRIRKIADLEAQKKEIEKQINSLKDEIKEEMQGNEVLETDKYIIRFTNVLTERFDSKRFKEEFSEMYSKFTNKTESRRFSFVAR